MRKNKAQAGETPQIVPIEEHKTIEAVQQDVQVVINASDKFEVDPNSVRVEMSPAIDTPSGLPAEALAVLANAVGVYRKKPWAVPGFSAKSDDGRLWKASENRGTITLYGHKQLAIEDAGVRERRMLEEKLQPLITRVETFEGVLAREMTEDMRRQYNEMLTDTNAQLSEIRAKIASLPLPQVDPVTGKRMGEIDTFTFDGNAEFSLS